MSEYRDDMNDTLRVQEQAFLRSRSSVVEIARLGDGIVHRFGKTVSDTVELSDDVRERRPLKTGERAGFGDEVRHTMRAKATVADGFLVADQVLVRLVQTTDEAAKFSDETLHELRARTGESAAFGDVVLGKRLVRDTVVESLMVRDTQFQVARDLVQEPLVLADVLARSKMRAAATVTEALKLADPDQDNARTGLLKLESSFVVHDEAWGIKRAKDTIDEDAMAFIDDARQHDDVGQAWTSSMDGWAMSRYAPFTFTGVAVISGTVHVSSPLGVFALDGRDEEITATVQTGLIDMTGENLSNPDSAYVEYELDGTAEFGVTQTQSGQRETFTYPLRARPQAEALTNARAVFGRGLRGRHFAYSVTLTGTHGYINDWGVMVAPMKRRI